MIIEDKNNVSTDDYAIRRLTPRECWRLMDFSDSDFDKAKAIGMSDTQLYKQAGNSICVGVLYHIYKNLYNAMPYLFDDLKVSSFFSGIGAFEKGLDRLYAEIIGNMGGYSSLYVVRRKKSKKDGERINEK